MPQQTAREGAVGQQRLARRRAVTVAWVLATVLGAAACAHPGDSADSARQSVSASYARWAAAVARKDGDAAADQLSASSLRYYDTIRTAALDDDRAALSVRPAVDQLTVLSLRANLPAPLLRTGSPHDVVRAGVTGGVSSAGSSPQEGLGEVAVDGNRASAVLKLAGDEPQSYRIGFVREHGAWRFDLTSLLPVGQASLAQVQKAAGISTSTLVETVERDRVGRRRAEQLWTPIGRS